MFEMDKCREEFEVVARKNGWNLTTYPEITGRIDYVNVLTEQAWQMFQHQQAKVEELEKEWLEMNQQQEQAVKECFEVNAENRKLQKRVQFLKQELGAWKGKSIAAMINGMCKQCGKEPWQAIVSDKEGYALLHCFGCGANKYELVGEQALKGEG
ncbi:hypothetical protein R0627_002882 [Acinetobacter baumannii]|nr:hypothetical protein [Acinetobacter baumannii]ELA6692071.1 hypothetical protein [Acinetobacter baumannii]ELA6696280.1 hypothetical protein [Acinetobacter baumannii]ELO7552110.1 hypothetical protein [Acinetobacter baumannii]